MRTPSCAGGEETPTFAEYLRAELNPAPLYPTADSVWGETERQRVYASVLVGLYFDPWLLNLLMQV